MINRIIFQLVRFIRSDISKTAFFKAVKHNADLCPRYEEQIDLILQAFQKYQSIAYDIQGPRDRGTDIVIKLPRGDEVNYICFQIKSEDDLKDKDYLKNLKAQFFDTKQNYKNILDYYILLSCDAIGNKDKIRTIAGDFSKEKNVHVIIPEYALTFYRLGLIQIDALIKAKLGSDDEVYRKALGLVNDIIPTEKAILFYLIWAKIFENSNEVSFNYIYNSCFISAIYSEVPDYDKEWFFTEEENYEDGFDTVEELKEDECDYKYKDEDFKIRGLSFEARLAEDLDRLEDTFFSQKNSGAYELLLPTVYPLITLLLDGHIRYEYEGAELLRYMMSLFAPMKGYKIASEW